MDWLSDIIKILQGPRRDVPYSERTPGQAMWDSKANIMQDLSQEALRNAYNVLSPWETGQESDWSESIGVGNLHKVKGPLHDVAQKAIQEGAVQRAEAQERREQLEQAAAQQKWAQEVQSQYVDTPMSPAATQDSPLSDPSKGIMFAGLTPEQIKRIRAQASTASGRTAGTPTQAQIDAQSGDMLKDVHGNTPGGWVESTSPEIALQRQGEMEDWTSDQWLRDIRHELTRRGGMGEQAPARAGYSLAQLGQVAQQQQAERSKQKLLDSLAGQTGKIPYDKVGQYQMAGIPIPLSMIGMSRDEAKTKVTEALNVVRESLNNPMAPLAEKRAANALNAQLGSLWDNIDVMDPEMVNQALHSLKAEAFMLSNQGTYQEIMTAPGGGGLQLQRGVEPGQ